MPKKSSRIQEAKRAVRELTELVENLDPLLIRIAALGFLVYAIVAVFRAH